MGDTITALSSPPGRSARAVVRLSGPATREVLGTVLEGPARPFERECFKGRLRLGEASLPVLVATYRAPASYTGEDGAEVLLPGNPLLVERVLARLAALPGVRAATPGEFTARAYLNDRLSLDQAEGIAAVIAAENEGQLEGARELLTGRTGTHYRRWAEEVATLLALVEAGIDFTDQEDVVPITPGALRARLWALAAEIESFVGARAGREPMSGLPRVVLAGEPNAGKSTLFNALLGRRRAVVSPVAGTTRDVLEEELDLSRELPGAGAVVLVDLAGVDGVAGRGAIDAAAQSRARDAIARADVVVQCDPSGRFAPVRDGAPVIRVRTKADLPGAPHDTDTIELCALDGYNLGVLRRAIAEASCTSRSGAMGAVLPRHARALTEACDQIARAAESAASAEVAAAALRGALDALGEVTGRISPDDIIGRIFATFCVGK